MIFEKVNKNEIPIIYSLAKITPIHKNIIENRTVEAPHFQTKRYPLLSFYKPISKIINK